MGVTLKIAYYSADSILDGLLFYSILPQFLLLLIAKRISSAVIKITKIAYKSFALITRIYELRSVLNFVNLKCQVAEICSMRTYYSCVGTTMMLQCRQWNLYIHLLFHRIKLLDNKYLAQRIQRPIIKLCQKRFNFVS